MKSTSLLYDLLHQVLNTLLAPSTHWLVRLISLLPFIVLSTVIVIILILEQPEQLSIIAGAAVAILSSCSGQLIPDSNLRFSSATTGGMPSLNE